jgi:hypothetical protein
MHSIRLQNDAAAAADGDVIIDQYSANNVRERIKHA